MDAQRVSPNYRKAIAIAAVTLTLYVLSAGPALFIVNHKLPDGAFRDFVIAIHWPLDVIYYYGPGPISQRWRDYLEWWVEWIPSPVEEGGRGP